MATATTDKGEILALKRRAGKQPFAQRLRLVNDFCKCPFHAGDSDKSMHLYQAPDGVWLAKCFSECNKSWDAIAFVQDYDKIDFATALERLGRVQPDTSPVKPKPKPAPMTADKWAAWGQPITQADVDAFAASRPHSHTAALETLTTLGVRRKGEYLGFPYKCNRVFSGVKMRRLDKKEFVFANAVDTSSLFNLDAVNPIDDCYIVEGEPDVATMAENGFVAVSPFSSQQQHFSTAALARLAEAPRLFVIGDMDEAGQHFVDRIMKALPGAHRIKFADANDVGELALKFGEGFANVLDSLAKEAATPAAPWVRTHVPRIHQLSKRPKLWLADRMVPYGGLTLASGRQGSMKSLFALWLAHRISGGNTFLGRNMRNPIQVEGGLWPDIASVPAPPVVYIDRENDEADVEERRARLGIIGNNDFHYWGEWVGDTPGPDDERLFEFVRRERAFVVFDSLQQFLGDLNENDNADMTKLMGQFRRLARAGAGVLVLHHNNKPDRLTGDSTSRGATAIPANTDMALLMRKNKDTDAVEIREDRFRGCAPWELDFRVTFGKQYTIEVVRDETLKEMMDREKQADAEADKKQAAQHAAEVARVAAIIDASPTARPSTIERRTGDDGQQIRRGKIITLAGEAGWVWKDNKDGSRGGHWGKKSSDVRTPALDFENPEAP
jgi:hypothetical protein